MDVPAKLVGVLGFDTFHCDTYCIYENVASHNTVKFCYDAFKPLFSFLSSEKKSTQGRRWSTAFKKKTLSVCMPVCIFVNISKRREIERKEMSILFISQ